MTHEHLYGETPFTSYRTDFFKKFPTKIKWDALVNVIVIWVDKVTGQVYQPLEELYIRSGLEAQEKQRQRKETASTSNSPVRFPTGPPPLRADVVF